MSDKPKHAEFSASGSDRWLNCPGSIRLARVLPRSESSIYALEGTAAHAVGESCLLNGIFRADFRRGQYVDIAGEKPKFFASSKPIENPPATTFLIDQDMIDAVNVYLEFIEELKTEMPDAETEIEARLDLSWIRPGMFGTGDYVAANWMDVLHIVDYKHGKGVGVEAYNNSQMKYYALGAAKRFDFEFNTVRMTVVQPRFYHADGPVRTHEMSMDELRLFEKELAEGYDRAIKDDGMLNPGDWCKFCPALGIPEGQPGHCAASWAKAQEVAMTDFKDAPALNDEGGYEIPLPATVDEYAKALAWLPFIDNWSKKVAAAAETMALQGTKIPGRKLVEKRTIRKWSDFATEEDIVEELQKEFDLPKEDLYAPPKLRSPTQVEKLLKAPEKRKLAATGLIIKPEGALTLVSEADSRPEKVPQLQAAADFEGAPDA